MSDGAWIVALVALFLAWMGLIVRTELHERWRRRPPMREVTCLARALARKDGTATLVVKWRGPDGMRLDYSTEIAPKEEADQC